MHAPIDRSNDLQVPMGFRARREQRLHALVDVRHWRQQEPYHSEPGQSIHCSTQHFRQGGTTYPKLNATLSLMNHKKWAKRIILNVTLLQVTKREYSPENIWKDWNWRSEGDLLMNGAVFVPSGVDPNTNSIDERDLIKAKPGTFVTRLTRYSGALDCVRGRPC